MAAGTAGARAVRPSARGACVIVLALASAGVQGACPLNVAHYRVGADVTYCTHNDIQSAINAVGSCPVVVDITREHLYTGQH
jgi:hypothetical protein